MKKSVYIGGICCTTLMLLGSMSKALHWPGANVMLILSVALFCVYFLPAALMNSYNEQKENKRKALYVVSFIVFFLCMVSVLFKVLHWPGAGELMFIGILFPFVVFLPVYLYHTREDSKINNKNFMGVMFGLIFLALFTVLLSMTVSRQILHGAAASANNNQKAIAFSKTLKTDVVTTIEVQKASLDLFNYVEELKCELLNANQEGGCSGKELQSDFNFEKTSEPDNKEIPKLLFNTDEGKSKVEILKEKISAYRSALLAAKNISPELKELVNNLFDLNDKEVEEGNILSWENRELSGYSLVLTLDALTLIQNNTLLLEKELATL